MDTIFALASAHGKAGVAVVRVSGPNAWSAVQRLCGHLPQPRKTSLRTVRDLAGNDLDEALIVTFEEQASFTGEQSAELQLHGSIAVVSAVLGALGKVDDSPLGVEAILSGVSNDGRDGGVVGVMVVPQSGEPHWERPSCTGVASCTDAQV